MAAPLIVANITSQSIFYYLPHFPYEYQSCWKASELKAEQHIMRQRWNYKCGYWECLAKHIYSLSSAVKLP